MAEFPVSLDNLIAYVRSMHVSANPLENLTDAVQVAATLDEQSDALIGYFVDQARRAGAPWSEIGASMGVSKQAVQKRFVARADDLDDFDPDAKPFSRFTDRARTVVRFARVVAASVSADNTTADHLTLALLPAGGVAVNVIHEAGLTDEELLESFGIDVLPPLETASPERGVVPFADDAKQALRQALMAALRLGHNYIGTEHILLGVLRDKGEAAEKLESLGLSTGDVEEAVKRMLDEIRQQHKAD